MIRSLTSSLPTFKALRLHEGLNVILAQKSPGATDRQTRNGAGKTCFLELVHFLLGASCRSEHFLQTEPLRSHSYAIDFDLAGKPTEVERTPANDNRIVIANGDVSAWPRTSRLDKKTGHLVLSNTNWRRVLGNKMFGLPVPDDDEDEKRFGPTFRSMFSYFFSGAFLLIHLSSFG